MKKLYFSLLGLFLCVLSQGQAPQERVDTLSAAIVQTAKEKLAARSQTSIVKLDSVKLKRGFAVLGTPDLIKTLQILPGVASGTELSSGLYVRGGDGSDNLFLLDGVPLYQVSHVIGLFSSFNTDVTDGVDFYKGGFPARYGGRLSSVVDVDVKAGNFTKWKGTASLGLIDGHFQIEGPLVKNKTSLNFGMRRTWLDVIKTLAMPAIKKKYGEVMGEEVAGATHFDFGDFNLKLVHLLSPTAKLSLSAYYGHDYLTAKGDMNEENKETGLINNSNLKTKLIWGNTLASLRWEQVWPESGWSMDSKVYYTNYTSDIVMDLSALQSEVTEGVRQNVDLSLYERDFTRIHDIGAASDWLFDGLDHHHIRMGVQGVGHIYDPYRKMDMVLKVNSVKYDEAHGSSSLNYLGAEIAPYIEDEISLGERLKVNLGLRDALFLVKGRAYNRLEPRLAIRLDAAPWVSLKASYAKMNQFSHLVSVCYIDLPTNLWMPSTSRVKPMSADQFVLGALFTPSEKWNVDIEAFYKKMEHLYEYDGTNSMLPKLDKWELDYLEGRGRAYGAELSVEYIDTHFFGALYYTLSRSERLFPTYYHTWFPDRNDNLHRLTLNANYRFSPRFELYACWTYHTGNRFTAASSLTWIPPQNEEDSGNTDFIYSMPNNYHLPDYHRLDVGLNWHKYLRDGRSRTLNVSIYNAYNRVNALFGTVDVTGKEVTGTAFGVIPIIPTISYTWRF